MSRQAGSIVRGFQSRAGYPSKRAGSRWRLCTAGAAKGQGRPERGGRGVSIGLVRINDLTGRGGRARTCDNRFWRPVLYQLSYTPSALKAFGLLEVQRGRKQGHRVAAAALICFRPRMSIPQPVGCLPAASYPARLPILTCIPSFSIVSGESHVPNHSSQDRALTAIPAHDVVENIFLHHRRKSPILKCECESKAPAKV